MRARIALNDESFRKAEEWTGIAARAALRGGALKALRRRAGSRRLVAIGGSQPDLGCPADDRETYQAAPEKVAAANVNAMRNRSIDLNEPALQVFGNPAENQPPLAEPNLGENHTIDITMARPGALLGRQGAAESRQ